MTVILTALLPGSVIQASDRLVVKTRRGSSGETAYRPHDATANKSVVYIGANCRLLIGYTGRAYVGSVPTDQWIAEKVAGHPIGEAFDSFIFPKPMARNAMEVLEILAETLPDGVMVDVGGYQKTRRGDSARSWGVSRRSIHENRRQVGNYMSATMIPPGWERPDDLRIFLREIQIASPDQCPTVLAALIQRIASHSPAVGGAVMVVELPRYRRSIRTSLYVDPAGDNSEVMYSPTVVAPGLSIPPMRLDQRQRRFVISPGAIAFGGPVRRKKGEWELLLNVNLAHRGGTFRFSPQLRSLPPRLW